jgi:hypothetical protein
MHGVYLTRVPVEKTAIQLQFTAIAATATCPLCSLHSSAIHSRCRRRLSDVPWGTRTVQVQLTAGAPGYLAGMLMLARPLLRRVAARWTMDPLPRGAVAAVFVALLLSALAAGPQQRQTEGPRSGHQKWRRPMLHSYPSE